MKLDTIKEEEEEPPKSFSGALKKMSGKHHQERIVMILYSNAIKDGFFPPVSNITNLDIYYEHIIKNIIFINY